MVVAHRVIHSDDWCDGAYLWHHQRCRAIVRHHIRHALTGEYRSPQLQLVAGFQVAQSGERHRYFNGAPVETGLDRRPLAPFGATERRSDDRLCLATLPRNHHLVGSAEPQCNFRIHHVAVAREWIGFLRRRHADVHRSRTSGEFLPGAGGIQTQVEVLLVVPDEERRQHLAFCHGATLPPIRLCFRPLSPFAQAIDDRRDVTGELLLGRRALGRHDGHV